MREVLRGSLFEEGTEAVEACLQRRVAPEAGCHSRVSSLGLRAVVPGVVCGACAVVIITIALRSGVKAGR